MLDFIGKLEPLLRFLVNSLIAFVLQKKFSQQESVPTILVKGSFLIRNVILKEVRQLELSRLLTALSDQAKLETEYVQQWKRESDQIALRCAPNQ
ncbi:unnamed protein product [Protopolystoma xenopodis]|uniref:Uncharacterized protein n=1 Tax=Protopolystoma xenopodis TaxID=117903 RepID=A0A448WZ37_9PLAT|nr:unnamed protein product [Protopolystoma xenopodis]